MISFENIHIYPTYSTIHQNTSLHAANTQASRIGAHGRFWPNFGPIGIIAEPG